MAEGLARHLLGPDVQIQSAGSLPGRVHPLAIQAMAEIGIDISGQESKTLERYLGREIDWLVTVCDQARESCPVLPGVRNQRHWSIEDPAGKGIEAFRAARDELRGRIDAFVSEVAGGQHDG